MQEPLQHWAVGQAGAEGAMRLAQQPAGDVGTQAQRGEADETLDVFWGEFGDVDGLIFDGQSEEFVGQAEPR